VEDALDLIQQHIWKNKPSPHPVKVVEDVDISKMDAGHIRPNMEEPVSRGIWFPMGYTSSRARGADR
jgi:hypothetical protein